MKNVCVQQWNKKQLVPSVLIIFRALVYDTMQTYFDSAWTLFVIFVILVVWWYGSIPRNLPPGPFGLPILGCLHSVRPSTAHLTFQKWSKKYGRIFSFYQGNQIVVVLTDFESIQEALLKHPDLVFHGKPSILSLKSRPPKLGILQSEGARWKEQRRFALSTLRDFGFGRPILEPKVAVEVQDLLKFIDETEGEAFDPHPSLNSAVSNVICSMIFGRRFEKGSKVKHYLDEINYRVSQSRVNHLSPLRPYPWLRYFLWPFTDKVERFIGGGEGLIDFMKEEIELARKKYDPTVSTEPPDCLVHAFDKTKLSEGGEYFDDIQLVALITDLFLAGSDTTTTTMRWALYYMATHQDIQNKVHQEIVERFGIDEHPSYADRTKLPFTEATLLEIQRSSTLLPLSLPHRVMDEVNFMGYTFPNDTMVVPLIWAVHHDEKYFPAPDQFEPSRFLDEKGNVRKNMPLVPFSVGKRICLGESLARMELFLLFTAMMQRYKFLFPFNRYEVDQPFVGFLRSPAKFLLCAQKR